MPNLSKESKQQIALNYAKEKTIKEKNELILLMSQFISAYRSTILKQNKNNVEDFRCFLKDINDVKPLANAYFRESINVGMFALPVMIESVKIDVNSKNDIHFHFSNTRPMIEVKDRKVSEEYFNYDVFEKTSLGDLLEVKEFFDVYNLVVEKNKDFQELIQTHYDNLYELIKNIRTLDRIEKQFPKVHDYLPDDVKYNEDKESVNKKFAEL